MLSLSLQQQLLYCKTSHSVAVFLYVANRNQKLIAAPSRTCLFLKSEIKHLPKKKKMLVWVKEEEAAPDDVQDAKSENAKVKRSVGTEVPAESFEDFNLTIGNPADHEHK